MSQMEFIPTNDAFHHFQRMMGLHKQKDLVQEIFVSRGWDVSKTTIKNWDTKTGGYNERFRSMPRQALDDFIDECYQRRLGGKLFCGKADPDLGL